MAESFAKRIPPCSHVVVFYNTFHDKWKVLSALINGNLEKEQSVIYFSNGSDDCIASKLHEDRLALAKMLRSGRVSIADGERWYLEEQSLKEGRISDTWMEAVQDTLSGGSKGLCVICEPARILGPDLSRVLGYEGSLPRRFSSPLSVICQYSVEDLLSLEDGNLLMKLTDAHRYVVTPRFGGTIGFLDHYGQSLTRSLESILGKTITSVFFSFVKAKHGNCRSNQYGPIEHLDRYLNEFFGENASRVIKKHVLKEQYERVGLRFKSLI